MTTTIKAADLPEGSVAAEAPCRCHHSHAAVTPFHAGHCCFWPASQTCHADEVRAWEEDHKRWH